MTTHYTCPDLVQDSRGLLDFVQKCAELHHRPQLLCEDPLGGMPCEALALTLAIPRMHACMSHCTYLGWPWHSRSGRFRHKGGPLGNLESRHVHVGMG